MCNFCAEHQADAKQIIRKAIVHANEDMIRLSAADADLKNMDTTVVLVARQKGSGSVFVSGVGESRSYLVRNKKIEGLTADQKCADALCELALDSGSRDNVSCIVIEVLENK